MRQLRILLNSKQNLLFAAIAGVNLGNYLLNLVLGRILGPAHFSEVGILATGVLILSFIALAVQMTAAKFTASTDAGPSEAQEKAVGHWIGRQSLRVGILIMFVVAMFASKLVAFLQFSSIIPILIFASGIPIYLTMSVGRGVDQGNLEFGRLAKGYALEMGIRLVVTLAGLLVLRMMGIETGYSVVVAVGFLVSFVGTWWFHRSALRKASIVLPDSIRRNIIHFATIIAAYEFTQILINYSDIILIKHFFGSHDAGIYTGLALIGRIVYFATWSIVMVLFPKVIQLEKEGRPHHQLFNRSFGMVTMAGLVIIGVCSLFPSLIVNVLFGASFAEVEPLLWQYAVATTLFACANVFAYYYMSLNQYLPVVLTGLVGILQVVCIMNFHNTLSQVVTLQIGLMAGLFVSMIIYHFIKHLYYEKAQNSYRISLSSK